MTKISLVFSLGPH